MKRNKFAILSALVLGLVTLWLYIHNDSGSINNSIRHFNIEDPSVINKIILTKSNSSIILQHQPSGDWMVNGLYNANSNAVKSLLYTIKNIQVEQPVDKKIQSDVLNELIASGVKCEIFGNDRLIKTYYVGNETPDNKGTYMVMIDTETQLPAKMAFVIYIPGVDGNLALNYSTEEKIWRNRTVFHYIPSDILSVKMEVPESPATGFELTVNKPGDFQITASPQKSVLRDIDTTSVKQYLSYFEQLSFESFVTDLSVKQKDSLLRSVPLAILTVTDRKGKTNKAKFFPLKNKGNSLDRDGKPLTYDPNFMLALINNDKDPVIVKYFEFGKVMPSINYFQRKGS